MRQENYNQQTTTENELLSHHENNNMNYNANNNEDKGISQSDDFIKDEKLNSVSQGYKIVKESAILTSLMAVGSTTAVLFTNATVSVLGFTTAGVIKGSLAATLQSYFYGGATTGLFSFFQSVGVLGLGFGAVPVAVSGAVGCTSLYIGFKLWQRRFHRCVKEDEEGNNCGSSNSQNEDEDDDNTKNDNINDDVRMNCDNNMNGNIQDVIIMNVK